MILLALICVLFLGGFAAWFSERWSPLVPRWVAIITLTAEAQLLVLQYSVSEQAILPDNGLPSVWFADLLFPSEQLVHK